MSTQDRNDTIGIIGYGRLGSTLARLLSNHYNIVAYDPYTRVPDDIRAESLSELACRSDLAIITVGPGAMDDVVSRLAALPNCRLRGVAESSSFKRGNIEKLAALPEGIATAGVHPMFGHGARTVRGHSVIVTPVPGRNDGGHIIFREMFERAGFKTIEMTASEHDNVMGVVLGIPYAIAMALDDVIGDNPRLYYESSGTTFKALFTVYATSRSQRDLAMEIVSRPESRRAIRLLAEALFRITENSIIMQHEPGDDGIDSGLFYRALYCLVEDCLGE